MIMNRLRQKGCKKCRVANIPSKGSERTNREQARVRKDLKSQFEFWVEMTRDISYTKIDDVIYILHKYLPDMETIGDGSKQRSVNFSKISVGVL